MNLQNWASNHLSQLGVENADAIVNYLIELETESLVEEYLNAMLDPSNSSNKEFINEFLKKYTDSKSGLGAGFYHKPDLCSNGKLEILKPKSKEKPDLPTVNSSLDSSSAKKKSKFVSIYSDEGHNKDVILIPGRHKCNCQASKHKLINNCLKCGRIVCEQEGSGPCCFCGNLVTSNEEEDFINKGTKKSEALYNKLMHSKKVSKEDSENKTAKGLQKAIEHKNRLLEFDKTSEKRTKVYDDQSDYFQLSSKWINPSDKDALRKYEQSLHEKRHSRGNKSVTIDILGRKVVEDEGSVMYNPNDPVIKEILEKNTNVVQPMKEIEEALINLNLACPEYVSTYDFNQNSQIIPLAKDLSRIQDKEIQEMKDDGMCLSMHQPWASLLISGIKKHEGRSWYSSLRGRLWIAAAAKVPSTSDISQVEQMYRVLYKKDNIKFPLYYPTGCLLGCVDVEDILPQEEYRVKYPDGESDSPYVFICENPQEMLIKFPMKGNFKIYKLDSKIHQAAKKALKH